MIFSEEVMRLLHDYKRILKRYVSPDDREAKIQQLRLERKNIRSANDVLLYRKAEQVIEDINSWISKSSDAPTAYYGLEEFCQHLNAFLKQYCIEGDTLGREKVVHAQRLASRAIVDAIQLLDLSSDKLTATHLQQLDGCFQVIAKYGTKEQQDLLMKALRSRNEAWHAQVLSPLLNSFKSYMQAKTLMTEYRRVAE